MELCKVLLSLPECLFCSLAIDWLQLIEVGRLDSAFSNPVVYRCPTIAGHTYIDLVRWSVQRGARLDFFDNFKLRCDDSLAARFLAISGSSVRFIRGFGNAENFFDTVIKWCSHAESVELYDCTAAVADEWLPAMIKALPHLHHLAIIGLSMSPSKLTDSLIQCPHLRSLGFASCADYKLPIEIALPTLQELHVREGKVNTEVIYALAHNCPQLRVANILEAAGANGTERSVEALLRGCPLLQVTDVEYADDLSQELRVELARRRNFSTIEITSQEMDENLLIAILRVSPSLTALSCRKCSWLTDAVLDACGQHCPLLETLNIKYCRHVTSQGLIRLTNKCTRLRELVLCRYVRIEEEALCALARACPNLTSLTCSRGTTNNAITVLASCCPRLARLSVPSSLLTDKGAMELVIRCKGLESLELSECRLLSLQGVRAIATQCPQLREINLMGCKDDVINDEAFRELARNCPGLTEVCCNRTVSDDAVVALAEGCPDLVTLRVVNSFVGDKGAIALATHCRKLRILDMTGCDNLTLEGVRAVVEQCVYLHTFTLPESFIAKKLPTLTGEDGRGYKFVRDFATLSDDDSDGSDAW